MRGKKFIEENRVLIRRLVDFGVHPPGRAQGHIVIDANGDIRIPDFEGEQGRGHVRIIQQLCYNERARITKEKTQWH